MRLKEARNVKPMDPSAVGVQRTLINTPNTAARGSKRRRLTTYLEIKTPRGGFPSARFAKTKGAASKRIELGLTLSIHEKKWTMVRDAGSYDARRSPRDGEWADIDRSAEAEKENRPMPLALIVRGAD